MLLAYHCSVCGNKPPKEVLESLFASPNRTRLCIEPNCEGRYIAQKINPKIKISVPTDFEDDIVVDAIASGALGPDISDIATTEQPRLPNMPVKKKKPNEDEP